MSGGLACLPMYDFPWTAPALDAVWSAVAFRLNDAGCAAPARLTRDRPLEAMWRDPALILGHTCGYPYWSGLRDVVTVIATPRYVFEGCEGSDHRSLIIARRDDPRRDLEAFRGSSAAINARDSNTGMNLFRAALAPISGGRPFFSRVVVTGAHAASLAAVAAGGADIAAIDCVSFGLIARGRPDLTERVRVVGRTPASPALPFIAAEGADAATIRRCLLAALEDPKLAPDLATLGLAGADVLDASAYARVMQLEQQAVALGYPELM